MFNIYKKELSYYLNNAVGYIAVIIFGLVANFLFMKDVFVSGAVTLKPFFAIIPWLFLVFVPALAMRSFAEEKRLNTIEVLLTLPVSETAIVIAKFLAYLTLLAIALALTLAVPVSFANLSHIYLPEVAVGYLGALLLGASFTAIVLYFSNLTKNQIVGFLSSALVIFALLGVTSELFASFFPKIVSDLISYFGPVYHFQNFENGVIDLRSLFFFLSLTALFLFLTVVQLEKRD